MSFLNRLLDPRFTSSDPRVNLLQWKKESHTSMEQILERESQIRSAEASVSIRLHCGRATAFDAEPTRDWTQPMPSRTKLWRVAR